MRLLSGNCSNPHLFIMNAIQQKRNSKMYLGTHESDYDEYQDDGRLYHDDVVHEDKHEDTPFGYVDISEWYHDCGYK